MILLATILFIGHYETFTTQWKKSLCTNCLGYNDTIRHTLKYKPHSKTWGCILAVYCTYLVKLSNYTALNKQWMNWKVCWRKQSRPMALVGQGKWCGCPRQQCIKGQKNGQQNKYIKSKKKKMWLHSTDFKILGKIKVNSINLDLFLN